MDSNNKKDETSGWECVNAIADMLKPEPIGIIILIMAISIVALMFNAIDRLINLFSSEKQKLLKIKSIKPESMHFHIASKRKIFITLVITALFGFGLIYTWVHWLISSIMLVLGLLIISIIASSLAIYYNTQASISADEKRIYIKYNYLFNKVKVKTIALKHIKKIIISENKIKIATIMGHTTLTAEPDSEAYAFFQKLKQKLN